MNDRKFIDGSTALTERRQQIIRIEATENTEKKILRVAAYTRVSSDSTDQLNSFAAQNDYYTELIARTKEWELADIYADGGITGTSVELRDDFKRMMADCRRGLIDKVICKSISRFARNTKECLEAIRELRSLGVGVHFEEQNIDTGDMSGEMVVAFLASFAQQESKSISDNVRWGIHKRMKAGTFNTCRAPYGFRLNKGELIIQEQEAKMVRRIYSEYLKGKSVKKIAAELRTENVSGRQWSHRSIEYILQNERYMGNALLQKRYTTDTLPRKEKLNHGERPQYLVQGSNEPIISQDTFERVQELREKRVENRRLPTGESKPLAKKLICAGCRTIFRHKTVRGIRYWICDNRDHGKAESQCPVPPVPEEQFYRAFLRLYYNLKHSDILAQLAADLHSIRTHRMLWREDIVELNKKISELSSQNQMLAELKKQGLIDPDIFIAQSNELAGQLRETKIQKESLIESTADHTLEQTRLMVEVLDDGPELLDAFNQEVFEGLIDRITVEDNEHIRFHLKNGLELAETIERTKR